MPAITWSLWGGGKYAQHKNGGGKDKVSNMGIMEMKRKCENAMKKKRRSSEPVGRDVAGKALSRAPLAPRLDGVVVELLEHSLKRKHQKEMEEGGEERQKAKQRH